jgi:hypothetical protein
VTTYAIGGKSRTHRRRGGENQSHASGDPIVCLLRSVAVAHRRIALTMGLVFQCLKEPDAFETVLLHELYATSSKAKAEILRLDGARNKYVVAAVPRQCADAWEAKMVTGNVATLDKNAFEETPPRCLCQRRIQRVNTTDDLGTGRVRAKVPANLEMLPGCAAPSFESPGSGRTPVAGPRRTDRRLFRSMVFLRRLSDYPAWTRSLPMIVVRCITRRSRGSNGVT